MPAVPHMPIREFMDLGYLQEVNRQFLHPLGLALTLAINPLDSDDEGELFAIKDGREDLEGFIFGSKMDYVQRKLAKERASYILTQQRLRKRIRRVRWGFGIEKLK